MRDRAEFVLDISRFRSIPAEQQTTVTSISAAGQIVSQLSLV